MATTFTIWEKNIACFFRPNSTHCDEIVEPVVSCRVFLVSNMDLFGCEICPRTAESWKDEDAKSKWPRYARHDEILAQQDNWKMNMAEWTIAIFYDGYAKGHGYANGQIVLDPSISREIPNCYENGDHLMCNFT